MDIERVLEIAKDASEKDRLGMILSNRIDMNYEQGCLISDRQFAALIDDLIAWKTRAV